MSHPLRLRSIRHTVGVALVLGLTCAFPSSAAAEASWGWAPGVKLAWTFGHGLTFGIEVSFIRLPDLTEAEGDSLFSKAADMFGRLISRTWGIVVNIDTTFRHLFRTRVGLEWVGPGLGLEAGPALIVDSNGAHMGLGITPWIGYHVIPYYTFTWVFGRANKNQHELGSYFKTSLLSFEGDSTYDDWDD